MGIRGDNKDNFSMNQKFILSFVGYKIYFSF